MSDSEDLGDFGGGRQEPPSPEDAVKISLSQWFKQHDAQVYWEKRPSEGHGVFKTSGGVDHPDLLVTGRYRTFAIEVKRGNDGAGIHDGVAQVKRYWEDYVTDEKKYYLPSGRPVDIDAFLVATKYAPDGKLFYRDGNRDPLRAQHIDERDTFEHRDDEVYWMPDWEHTGTESATRILWRFAKQTLDDSDAVSTGIGTMLSDRLDRAEPERLTPSDTDPDDLSPMPAPKALYQTFDTDNGIAAHNWRWVK
jgi:hypothetical protein